MLYFGTFYNMIYEKFFELNSNYLKNYKKIAVAVSGGSDSMALCFLLHRYFEEHEGELFCLTIDHGLRPESFDEALHVQNFLKSFKINHQIIEWQGPKPTSNIQEEARNARYNLLTEYCRKNNITLLTTGHQQNDQAENFIIRAEHGSGLWGLSGIPITNKFNNIEIFRPLLKFSKQELQDFLQARNIKWVEDPSNENLKFARVRARKLLNKNPLWVEKLSYLTENLAKARESIEYCLSKIIEDIVDFKCDRITISLDQFNELPQELKFRMLIKLLNKLNVNSNMPRGERVEALIEKISKGKNFKASTLSGCLISRKKDNLTIQLENKSND